MRALGLAAAACALLIAVLARACHPQPQGEALLGLQASASQLNLTRGEVAALVLTVVNLGAAPALNVTLRVTGTGCAQFVGEGSRWVSEETFTLGDLAAGSGRRVVIPVRCLQGRGAVTATAVAENSDPTFVVVRVVAEERGEWGPLLAAAAVALLAASAAAAVRRRRAARRRGRRRRA